MRKGTTAVNGGVVIATISNIGDTRDHIALEPDGTQFMLRIRRGFQEGTGPISLEDGLKPGAPRGWSQCESKGPYEYDKGRQEGLHLARQINVPLYEATRSGTAFVYRETYTPPQ